MIKRYNDHAANERTFLAWVRTAIAVMAFGFVIERFDLFLQAISSQRQPPFNSSGSSFGNAAGFAFIAIGVAMIAISAFRFTRTAKHIETEDAVPSPGERFDLALAVLLGLLGASLFLYFSRAVVPAHFTALPSHPVDNRIDGNLATHIPTELPMTQRHRV
jgi:putative membrane protein